MDLEVEKNRNCLKPSVRERAKKQIEDLVATLRDKEFMKKPAIKNLVEKVIETRKTQIESKVNATTAELTAVLNDVEKLGKTVKKKIKGQAAKSAALLDFISASDVANKIANQVLDRAEEVGEIWRKQVKRVKAKAENLTDLKGLSPKFFADVKANDRKVSVVAAASVKKKKTRKTTGAKKTKASKTRKARSAK